MPKVFLSYSNQDVAFARRLYERLTHDGAACFFAQESLEPGSDWIERLQDAIEDCDWLILVITPHYLQSPWSRKERNAALAASRAGKPIMIPLLLQDCELPHPHEILRTSIEGSLSN